MGKKLLFPSPEIISPFYKSRSLAVASAAVNENALGGDIA